MTIRYELKKILKIGNFCGFKTIWKNAEKYWDIKLLPEDWELLLSKSPERWEYHWRTWVQSFHLFSFESLQSLFQSQRSEKIRLSENWQYFTKQLIYVLQLGALQSSVIFALFLTTHSQFQPTFSYPLWPPKITKNQYKIECLSCPSVTIASS